MEQPGRPRPLIQRAIAGPAAIVVLLGLVVAVGQVASDLLSPFLGHERIERVDHGFAISLPRDWEHADAEVFDEDWWDPANGSPAEQYEQDLELGAVLRARSTEGMKPLHEQCTLYVLSVDDAQYFANTANDDPDAVSVEFDRVELPGGSAVAYDVVHDDGWTWRVYLVTDGSRWLLLGCGSPSPPADRWRPIADSIEFLPRPSPASPTAV